FEVAMNVDSVAGDPELLAAHGWGVVDPLAVSADPWRYRDYVRGSRGEFTVAKDMNVRLRSGWFSDRAACYLAAGRPVVEQDTGFRDVLPLGPGLHAFRTVEEAAAALGAVEADYARASAHAAAVAGEFLLLHRELGRGELDLRPRRVGNPGRGRWRHGVGRGRGRPERIVDEVGEDHEVLRKHAPRLQHLHRLGHEVARMRVVEV